MNLKTMTLKELKVLLKSFSNVSLGVSDIVLIHRIEDEIEVTPAEKMISDLLSDSDDCIKILKRVYDLSEREGEHGFSNFLAESPSATKSGYCSFFNPF